ncbi:MAG: regulatory protein RecX [Acidiferrobacterales bacterium]|nr:regulatory protein RecX [Acidiferrobacterales bacterium]
MALDMLARREHSLHELQQKLIRKGCGVELAAEVAHDLETGQLLSDGRFAEDLLRVRRERGYGPLRIKKEMQDKGVDAQLIAHCVDAADPQWLEVLKRVRRKKFGDRRPKSYQERARQARFLQYRGFTFDQIQSVLNEAE